MLIQSTEYSFSQIRSIFEKHGGNLKHLSLKNCYLFTKNKLDKLLRLVPNIESLALHHLCTDQRTQQQTIDKFKDYKFNYLKELSVIDCFSMEEILELIPEGVITSFTVDVLNMNTLKEFFMKQTNITRLRTSVKNNEQGFTQPYNHLKLQHLQLQYCHSASLPLIKITIENQPKLHILELLHIGITDDIFAAICCLKELRILKLSFNNLSTGVVFQMCQLKQLSELTVDYCYNNEVMEYIKDFSMIKNNKLQALDIMVDVVDEDFIRIRENNPNLQNINLKLLGKLNLNTELAKNFNKFKVIKIFATEIDIEPGNYESLLYNPHLQILHLELPMNYTIDVIRNMATMLPNMEDLKLKPINSKFTNETFNEILKLFPKLKELRLSEANNLSICSIFKSIEKYGLNLKIIMLLGLNAKRSEIDFFINSLSHQLIFVEFK